MSDSAIPHLAPPAEPSSLSAPLRIALLGYRSNPFSGGQGVYLKFLSKALLDAGHRVAVISGEPYPQLDAGVELIELPGLNLFAAPNHVTALRLRHFRSATDLLEWSSMLTGGFPEPYTFGRRLLARAGELLGDFDLVHDNQSLSWGTLALQRRGTPLVTTIHHPITWDRDIALAHAPDWRHRLLIRRWHAFLRMQGRVARRLRHIVTVSDRSRRDIAAAFRIDPSRIHVVHNGIDAHTFRPEPGVKRDPWQLITTASADQPLKGTQHLIPAFARLAARFPQLRLTFVGRPRPGGTTEALIDAAGVRDRIRFVHGVSAAEMRALYAQAAVAVVPSEYEGFGLPAGEAMACGVPLVSTDGGALPEVVGDAARVVPVGDVTALAEAIEALLLDPDARDDLSRQGRRRIVERFTWQRTAEQLTALYRQVLADSPGRARRRAAP